MKCVRKPLVNLSAVVLMSAFYAAVFLTVSGHAEFERILNHGLTLNSGFWDMWSGFLRQGRLKYVGYLYILLAAAVTLFTLVKKRDYDEYQCRMLEKGLIGSGVVVALLFPAALILVLSDPNYCAETITFLAAAHWLAFLVIDLIYAVMWCRS